MERSLLATYGPMLAAVVVTGGGAYVVNREEITTLQSKLSDAERRLEKHGEQVLKNTENIATLTERSRCIKGKQ